MACQVKSTWLTKKQNRKKDIQMEQWAGFGNNDFSGKRSRRGKHADSASRNGRRPSEQLFVQEEGKKAAGLR